MLEHRQKTNEKSKKKTEHDRQWKVTYTVTKTLDCLGAQIDIDGNPETMITGRLNAMQAHFWARAKQLRNKRVPLTVRVMRYVQTVRHSGLYLAGGQQ